MHHCGCVGTESHRGQRNSATHLTTLSGASGDSPDTNDNSYHLVYMDGTTGAGTITASTVLDGFTISDGNAGGTPGINQIKGGGLYCDGSGADVNAIFANGFETL